MDALLAAPDQQTVQGRRDHALLLFLYNSGARASEAADLKVEDFEGDARRGGLAILRGKGSKIRNVPLWGKTLAVLSRWRRANFRLIMYSTIATDRQSLGSVFTHLWSGTLNRFGTDYRRSHSKAREPSHDPSHNGDSPAPGRSRHQYNSWVAGPRSIDTTNDYAEADLEMKAKALAACEPEPSPNAKRWRAEPALMEFLKNL